MRSGTEEINNCKEYGNLQCVCKVSGRRGVDGSEALKLRGRERKRCADSGAYMILAKPRDIYTF